MQVRANSSIVDWAFILSIAFIAFNAAVAVDALGEGRSEPYILLNLFIGPLAVISWVQRGLLINSPRLMVFAAVFFVVVAISAVMNLDHILAAHLKDRSGLGRLVSTTLVPAFGFYFAYITQLYARASFYKFLAVPLLISAILVSFFGNIELVSWVSGSVYDLYLGISDFLHGALGRTFKLGRIQSVTAEASNFGMYSIFVTPFLWAFFGYFRNGFYRFLSAALVGNMTLLSLMSGRTSFFGVILINATFLFILSMFGAGPPFPKLAGFLLKAVFLITSFFPAVLIAIYKDDIALAVLESSAEGVSNISRFGTMAIQIALFLENPIFGVGMGQYPFYVPSHMLSWANNWEFQRWLADPQASFLPSFSIYTRLAGELGIIGYAIWVAYSYYLLHITLAAATNFYQTSGRYPWIGIAIICGFFGMQLIGWNIASYKVPYIWMIFGLATAYSTAPALLERRTRAVSNIAALKPKVRRLHLSGGRRIT
jgi:hypothetical protein